MKTQRTLGPLRGETEVRTGDGDPYLHWCPDCRWAGPYPLTLEGGVTVCPRCGSRAIGKLTPEAP